MTRKRSFGILSSLVSFLLIGIVNLQARELEWRALDVIARLDRDGRLHVIERHAMLFTGDWNGGERRFRLEFGQQLKLHRVSKVDPVSNTESALSRGDLSQVDHFAWHDSTTLRWRSRRPGDPPFKRTEIVYVLEYSLSNILVPEKNGFFLDHDFAFPDRPGPIRAFSLQLQIDPAWRPLIAFPKVLQLGSLLPGQDVVLAVPFEYVAQGRPAAVRMGASAATRYALIIILLAALTFGYGHFYRREKSLGRFDPLLPIDAIDEKWLRGNLLQMPPEVAGAAWDDTTAAPEVAAVLARLVTEQKIRTHIEKKGGWIFRKDVLHLDLLAERENLNRYETNLVNALFFNGSSTDTERIRKRYRSRGFDPASKIRSSLSSLVKRLIRLEPKPPQPSRQLAIAAMAAGLAFLSFAVFLGREEGVFALTVVGLTAVFYAAAARQATLSRKYVMFVRLRLIKCLLPILAYLIAAMLLVATNPFQLSGFLLSGTALLGFAAFLDVLKKAMCQDGRERIALKKRLASARRYFIQQLKLPRPQLKDEWLPYLIAFGLGPDVDRWFRAYGGSVTAAVSASDFGSSISQAGGWTGGGGRFGGAGATGSWAAAVGDVASGVSSSSSGSSGGGGGSSGGGSSGGGGGGGW
ncbi:MAG: DUF2207 domain-containing protein [Deltaproteobacteria bacterium]|nr:DUF2207 domain-containing protein [Deltaproteobacteria bacterium]